MILTPHILAGALIGAQTTNPIAAFIFGLISHYLIDKIPHWDYDIKKIQEKTEGAQTIKQWLKIGFDLALPLLIIGLIAPDEQILTLSLLGAAGGILPDFLVYLGWQFPVKILTVHAKFHDKNHTKIKLGLIPGLIICAVILILFFALYPS